MFLTMIIDSDIPVISCLRERCRCVVAVINRCRAAPIDVVAEVLALSSSATIQLLLAVGCHTSGAHHHLLLKQRYVVALQRYAISCRQWVIYRVG